MKQIFVLVLGCISFFSFGKDFQIYKNGQPQAAIVLLQPKHELAGEWASSLARFSKLCIGTALPISKTKVPGKNSIELNFRDQGFEDDSFTIEFPNDKTMRISGTVNSVKCGIVWLLENYFNVRFLIYYPKHLKRLPGFEADLDNDCPQAKDIAVPMVTVKKSPSVNLLRYFYQNFNWYTRYFGIYGGHGSTLFAFPIGKYAPDNSWPQEILPVRNGKKVVLPKWNPKLKNTWTPYRHGWQPCWSNPATVKIAVQNLREMLDKNPVVRRHGKRYQVELSVNDNGGCCECAKCLKAVNGKCNSLGLPNYSELYWGWIRNVALELQKSHPHIRIIAYTYREVFDPPSFKLPSNVIPQICREILIGARVPSEKFKIENTLKNWSSKAEKLLLYDYLDSISFDGYIYVAPRVHMKSYADMFKLAYRYKVRGVYLEACNDLPMSGPTLYLISRLYWDINTDLEAHFKEWCERAVGKKAAPFLMEYYREWERIWMSPEMAKTAWGLSHRGTYMPLNESGTYTYPITEKHVVKFDSLMANVVAKAETDLQKRRAKLFEHLWEMTRKSLVCLYSCYLQPDGTIASAENAVKLIRSIPLATKAQAEMLKDPYVPKQWNDILKVGICNFRGLIPYLRDARVKAALDEVLKNKELPMLLRASLEIASGSTKYKNCLTVGSFEDKKSLAFQRYRNKTSVLDGKHVSDGKLAYKMLNDTISFHCKAEYGKYYMVMVDIYSKITGGEGRLEFITNPRSGNGRYNTQYHSFRNIKVTKGWQTLSNTVHVSGARNGMKADSVWMCLEAKFFENDQPLWIDNVRIYKLD